MAMFGKDGENRKNGEQETIIGPSVKVDGKFSGQGNILIEGRVTGSMKTQEDIDIALGASVAASLEAKNVTVAGEVQGNIKARERLVLTETAKVIGDVEAKTVAIGAGAILNGKCTMVAEGAPVPVMSEQPVGKKSAGDLGRIARNNRKAEMSA